MNSAIELDKIDRDILWNLDLDARLPLTDLAGKIGLSKQGLNYRLNKLTETGIIKGYYAIIDTHRLGLLTYRLYLRLTSTSPAKTEKFLKMLCKHPNTLFVGTLTGSWDLEVVFTARNFIHFSNLIKELHEPFGGAIYRSNMSMTPVCYGLRRDYLISPQRKGPLTPSYGFEPDKNAWDELDFEILGALAVDGRITYDELARRFDVTNHTAKSRMLKLEKANVIRGYRADINTRLLGRQYVKALISLAPMSLKQERELYAACIKNSFVVYLTEVLGTWQLEIESEVTSVSELDEMIRSLRSRFPSLITDYDTVVVSEVKKLNYLPSGSASRSILAGE